MRVLRSSASVLFGVAILILGACGSTPPAPVDPVGGVAAAFEAARSGGTLKQMDLAACLTTGGAIGSSFGGLFGGITGDAFAKAGITPDDLNAAWKVTFDELKTNEVSRSGGKATVHVSVKVTMSVDAGKMRELVKKYGATQGIVPDDATIDALIKARLGGQLTFSETISKDIVVTQQGDKWVACGGNAIGATTTATPGPTIGAAATTTPPAATASLPPGPAGPPPSGDAIAVAAGDGHTCALLSSGGMKCWGTNGSGQLGSGATQQSGTPVDVVGLAGGITAIAGGGSTTCAVTAGGGVTCWGANSNGQLGADPRTSTSSSPLAVAGLSGVTALSLGVGHTCALTSAGGVKCWGWSTSLGNGSTTNSSTPVDVAGLTSGVSAISAGGGHTCAITSGGGLKCWGQNTHGELGTGTKADSLVPVDVAGLGSGVTAVAAGQTHTCATVNGGVKCWGGGYGPSQGTDGLSPLAISELGSDMAAIDAGADLNCGLTTGGGIKCWAGPRVFPIASSGMRVLTVNGVHACTINDQGGIACLGDNRYGQLGDGTTKGTESLVNVVGLGATSAATGNATAVVAASAHTCVVTTTGGVKCWGSNYQGRLGNGSTTDSLTPVEAFGLSSGITSLSISLTHACAVASGALKCWGDNYAGELGNGSKVGSGIPIDVAGLTSGVSAVAVGSLRTCAIASGGAVKCWGSNGGTLGIASTGEATTPADVVGVSSGATAIATGKSDTCVILSGGTVTCWGTYAGRKAVAVAGLTDVRAIAAGDGGTCAVTGAGAVLCWGEGGLGVGGNSNVPTAVPGISGATAVAVGEAWACAVVGGGVKCWGPNGHGALGNGTNAGSATPVNVSGLSSGVASIGAGGGHTCAVLGSGAVKCWGSNDSGALGTGSAGAATTTPVDVTGL